MQETSVTSTAATVLWIREQCKQHSSLDRFGKGRGNRKAAINIFPLPLESTLKMNLLKSQDQLQLQGKSSAPLWPPLVPTLRYIYPHPDINISTIKNKSLKIIPKFTQTVFFVPKEVSALN